MESEIPVPLKRNKKKKSIDHGVHELMTRGVACAAPSSSSSANPFGALGNALIDRFFF
ncbi:unnamed protein product [Prunus armeniaca]|uniref:Uncharacterized protein n=1 Tax=Prunus armeniaca TaxID=36596 RepID=A0A6J5U2G0_PRUAR|nr:unnamed protein product [Prunus armeniaca]